MILPITLLGDKILRKKVSRVEDVDFKTVELIKNMFETMRNASGIGLAANQVGADRSIFILDISKVEGYEEIKPMVLINPKIIERSEETRIFEEGCLSIPDIKADVERPESIVISYQDTDMKPHKVRAGELLARVMQHEFDHLRGILFTDLIDDAEKKRLKKDLIMIKNRKIDIDYPVTEDADYLIK